MPSSVSKIKENDKKKKTLLKILIENDKNQSRDLESKFENTKQDCL